MSTPKWTVGLSVGNEILDEHHRTLFLLLGELASGLDAAKDETWARSIGARLAEYMDYHFREEEAALAAVDYPFLRFHHGSHQAIAMRTHNILSGLGTRPLADVLIELRDFLGDWLTHHIEIEDFEYKPYLAPPG